MIDIHISNSSRNSQLNLIITGLRNRIYFIFDNFKLESEILMRSTVHGIIQPRII